MKARLDQCCQGDAPGAPQARGEALGWLAPQAPQARRHQVRRGQGVQGERLCGFLKRRWAVALVQNSAAAEMLTRGGLGKGYITNPISSHLIRERFEGSRGLRVRGFSRVRAVQSPGVLPASFRHPSGGGSTTPPPLLCSGFVFHSSPFHGGSVLLPHSFQQHQQINLGLYMQDNTTELSVLVDRSVGGSNIRGCRNSADAP